MTRGFIPLTVKGRAWYECNHCGSRSMGDSFTVDFTDIEDIPNYKPNPSHMPIGWGSYYDPTSRDEHLSFRCPLCHA